LINNRHGQQKEYTMTIIKAGVVALALAASFGALASSASAQTSRADRIAAARDARAQAQSPYQFQGAPYSTRSIGQEPANPYECRTNDGYGRYDTCDH
jgi:hypothetical protein